MTRARPVAAGAFDEPVDVEVAQLGADRFGRGRDDAAHLVQRLGAGLAGHAGRATSHAQNPHRFDVSVPGLGCSERVAGLGGPRRGDRIL
jgi:hypothetical protein